MTNEEKAKEIAEESKQYFYHDEYECGLACAKRMAKWKDEQFSIERKQLIEKANQAVTQSFENGAIFKKQKLIDKAAEWFRSRFPNMSNEAIEKFKEDMKGQ